MFTVYFKTVLFTIYLLPFLFWRPWQRLCCVCCRSNQNETPNQTTVTSTNDNEDNEISDDDVFEDDDLFNEVATFINR